MNKNIYSQKNSINQRRVSYNILIDSASCWPSRLAKSRKVSMASDICINLQPESFHHENKIENDPNFILAISMLALAKKAATTSFLGLEPLCGKGIRIYEAELNDRE